LARAADNFGAMTHYRISSRITEVRDGRYIVFVSAAPLGQHQGDVITESRECPSSEKAETCRQELSRHLADCVAAVGGRIVSVEIT
jgi:hypothetical protein